MASRAVRFVAFAVGMLGTIPALWLGDIPLGLDFEGGAELRYEVGTRPGMDDDAIVGQALEVMRDRVDALEMGSEDIALYRFGRTIVLDMTGADASSLERIRSVAGRSVDLRFVAVDDDWQLPEPSSLPPGIEIRTEPQGRYVESAARELLEHYLSAVQAPAGRELLIGLDDAQAANEPQRYRSYVVRTDAALGGDHIEDADVSLDPGAGEPVVSVTFDLEGGQALEALTRALVNRRLAIVVDRMVQSAPMVLTPIAGGRAQITLGGARPAAEALREAHDLVIVLRSGALPSPIRVVDETIVAPAVAGGTVRLAGIAALAVLLAIAALALVRYRVGGLAVAVGLPSTALLSLAAFAAMGATLTTYSVAAIGVAVTSTLAASALSLERARRRQPFWPRSAVAITIVHVAALVAGVVLFAAGSGPPRGFGAGLLLAIPGSAFVSLVFVSAMAASVRPSS